MTVRHKRNLSHLHPYTYKPEKRRRRILAMWFAVFVGSFFVAVAFWDNGWQEVYHPNQGSPNKKTYVVYVTPDQVSPTSGRVNNRYERRSRV